jgi:quinol monooxygenase YgiN
MSRSTQMFVYEVQPDKIDEFLAIKDRLIDEAHTLPGLIASATFRSNEQDNLFIDRMHWESAQAGEDALPLFEELSTTPEFMALMAGPPRLAGQFTLVAGS